MIMRRRPAPTSSSIWRKAKSWSKAPTPNSCAPEGVTRRLGTGRSMRARSLRRHSCTRSEEAHGARVDSSSSMKILYLCPDLGVPVLGRKGASIHVRELVAAFIRAGHHVVLAAQVLNKSPWEKPASVH